MATSTVPALKQALVAMLSARTGLTGVQVSYGPPLPAPSREYIWVGDVSGDQTYLSFAAPNQRHEEYQVTVTLSVLREGVDSKAADDRCFVMLAELEQGLRADVTVAGTVSEAHVDTFRLTEFVSPDGSNRTAQLVVDVSCQAFI